ncbi:MAG: DNA polymerase III subunit gamma/tau [Anaerolineae bacterium]|nr:DNA polymerase III subunit gamma/tau [Anaerolineae bacterium]
MASQALYRTWRAQTFSEIVGQEHVTRTLQNALRAGRMAHAYLFSGPRGTGQTSTARILAKAINCLAEDISARPDNSCPICIAINEGRLLDLIEIDAASNRGIDEIRDLRDKVRFAPAEARYKVYVIDEVHMLTNEAFNALLKTLEEPPSHVIFVLATTDPQRVPATVLSRCQRCDFRRICQRDTVAHLERILKSLNKEAESAALDEIARAATGSLRDAISLLDQLLASGQERLTLDQVHDVLGLVADEAVQELVEHLGKHETAKGLALINRFAEEGADLRQFARQIVGYLRGVLLLKVGDGDALLRLPAEMIAVMRRQAHHWSAPDLVRAVRLFNQAANDLRLNFQAQLPLELAFIEATLPTETVAPAARAPEEPAPRGTPARPPASETRPQPASAPPALPAQRPAPTSDVAAQPVPQQIAPVAKNPTDETLLGQAMEKWKTILIEVRNQSRPAEGYLRSSRGPLSVEDSVLVIGFRNQFAKDSMEDPKQKAVVEAVVSRVLGKETRVRCQMLAANDLLASQPVKHAPVVTPPASPPPPPEPPEPIERVLGRFAQERGGQVKPMPPAQGNG